MQSAERAQTLQYLHKSGAVGLLESIVQALLLSKPPPKQVLATLRDAALSWTSPANDGSPAPCNFISSDGASWVLQPDDEGKLAASRNGVFMQYVSNATFDLELRRLALDGLTAPRDKDAIQLPAEGLVHVLERIEVACATGQIAGRPIPHDLRKFEPLTFPAEDGVSYTIQMDNSQCSLFGDGKFRSRVTCVACDFGTRRLALDDLSRSPLSSMRVPAHALRSLLQRLHPLCASLGIPCHTRCSFEASGAGYCVESADDGWLHAYRDGQFVQIVSTCKWDGARIAFDAGSRLSSDDAITLAEAAVEEITSALAILCDLCGVPHDPISLKPRPPGAPPSGPRPPAGRPTGGGRPVPQQPNGGPSQTDEELAATKIQALARGRAKRKEVNEKRAKTTSELDDFFEDEERQYQDYCARIIQTALVAKFIRKVKRRVTIRRESKQQPTEEEAAVKIQKITRGRQARRKAKDKAKSHKDTMDDFYDDEERQYQDWAARVIQAVLVQKFLAKVKRRVSLRRASADGTSAPNGTRPTVQTDGPRVKPSADEESPDPGNINRMQSVTAAVAAERGYA